MNHNQPYMEMHPHLSSAQPYTPQSATAPNLSHYSQYQHAQVMQSGPTHYGPTSHSYGAYGYPNGVPSPQSGSQPPHSHQVHPQALTLPAMMPGPPSHHGYMGGGSAPGHGFPSQPTHQMDQTGQNPPPGMKPRVTATLWEDEGSLCYQVEAKGVCVARREDNHMINGTKLLNVAGMTRGRRDGILKSEKVRHVVKIGPMHLKGVWIPFNRALDFANKEKITDQLYPLFVHNIGGLLYHPTNESRTRAVVAGTERRRIDSGPSRGAQSSQPPALHHHHSMHGTGDSQMPPTPHSIAPHPGAGRPGLDRAHTFPTPPTSASSVLGMGNQGSSYDQWGASGMSNSAASSQPLSIDTGLGNARSMPTTPASTPPGSSISNIQTYAGQQGYDGSKSFYSGPPSSQGAYAPQSTPTQPNMTRFGAPLGSNNFAKTEMGPPSAPGGVGHGDAEHHDLKPEAYPNGHTSAGSADGATDHHHENGYMGTNASAYSTSRTQYAYHPPSSLGSSMGTVQSEHPHLSPEMTESPHASGSGRATPRASNGAPQWQPGYDTPPRVAPSSNLYSVMSNSQGTNGTAGADHYTSNYGGASLNGKSTSTKRSRDDENDSGRPDSRGMDPAFDMKRRKILRQEPLGSSMGQMSSLQPITTGGGMARQR